MTTKYPTEGDLLFVEVRDLAAAFSCELRDALSPRELVAAIARNATETSPGVCHTHDFCDANMIMLAAFTETRGAAPRFGEGDEAGEARDTALWNAAWNMAKAAGFNVRP